MTENHDQFTPEEAASEQKKISPMQFQMAANTYLEGTNMMHALNNVSLRTDAEGNIESGVVQSIKTMLRTAATMAKDEIVKAKINKLLDFMKEY